MRKEFTMTDEQYNKIIEACKPTMCIMIGGYTPPTPQENANRAWEALGKELGFNHWTVRPGKEKKSFTAEVIEPSGNSG
jgi:predicted TIM-barrel fold metal-dependent hydrolase